MSLHHPFEPSKDAHHRFERASSPSVARAAVWSVVTFVFLFGVATLARYTGDPPTTPPLWASCSGDPVALP